MPDKPKGPDKQPAHEMSREAANLLVAASDSGHPLTEAQLQEQLGVGHEDLVGILDQLRETGQASQVAPGMWSGPDQEGAQPRVVVAGPAEPEERGLGGDGPVVESEAGLAHLLGAPAGLSVEPTVRLTRSITEALSDEALGQLVKAGMGDTDVEGVFVLEVVP